jgi:RNA polymerase sigma factor (TIGR02999 family)
VYDEICNLAASRLAGKVVGHTLDATALVLEADLRLAGSHGFESKRRFVRAAAEAMRRILVDHTRKKRADERGGNAKRHERAEVERAATDPDTVLAVDEALAAEDPATVDVARLRLFTSPSADEAAEALGVSRATTFRDWAYD